MVTFTSGNQWISLVNRWQTGMPWILTTPGNFQDLQWFLGLCLHACLGVVKSLLEHKAFGFQWFWVHTRWCSLSADAGRFSCGSFLEPQQWTRNTDSEASKMSKRVQRLSNGIFISIPSQALSQGSGLYALWVCRVLSQSEPSGTRIASLEVRLGTSLEWNSIQPSKDSLVLCSYIILFAQTCQLGARKGAVLGQCNFGLGHPVGHFEWGGNTQSVAYDTVFAHVRYDHPKLLVGLPNSFTVRHGSMLLTDFRHWNDDYQLAVCSFHFQPTSVSWRSQGLGWVQLETNSSCSEGVRFSHSLNCSSRCWITKNIQKLRLVWDKENTHCIHLFNLKS